MKKELRSFINSLKKDELLSCVFELCETNEQAREFFELKVENPPLKKRYSKDILNKYKKKIDYWFFLHHEFDAETGMAWEVVEKFYKSHKDYPEFYLILILHWVKNAIKYTDGICVDYGAYYYDLTDAFKEALGVAKNNDLFDIYKETFIEIINSTERMGWATYDIMSDMFEEFRNKA